MHKKIQMLTSVKSVMVDWLSHHLLDFLLQRANNQLDGRWHKIWTGNTFIRQTILETNRKYRLKYNFITKLLKVENNKPKTKTKFEFICKEAQPNNNCLQIKAKTQLKLFLVSRAASALSRSASVRQRGLSNDRATPDFQTSTVSGVETNYYHLHSLYFDPS